MKKRTPRILLFIIAGLILLPIDLYVVMRVADRSYGTLSSAGQRRRYLLHVPEIPTSPNLSPGHHPARVRAVACQPGNCQPVERPGGRRRL